MESDQPSDENHGLPVQWVSQAHAEIDEQGLPDKKALLFELRQALDHLSESETSVGRDRAGREDTNERLDRFGSLLVQFYAAHHGKEVLTDVDPAGGSDTIVDSPPALETPDEEAVRRRVEQLIEQGVSSVSRVSRTVVKEFDNVDRREVNQIAAEVREEAGEMETLGNPDDLVD